MHIIVSEDNLILSINISHFIFMLNFLTCDDESSKRVRDNSWFMSNVGKFPDYPFIKMEGMTTCKKFFFYKKPRNMLLVTLIAR